MAVYKPELRHVVDMVVLPTTGPRPLAGMCSGGDYDGDSFWICFEPTIVAAFKNAPAPQSLPDPSIFGIEVDTRKVREVIPDPNNEEQARILLQMETVNRQKMNMLGTITKTLEKQVYKDNSLSTLIATTLVNLKDLIMDSDKNGRDFPREAWIQVLTDLGISHLLLPAYYKETAAKDDEDSPCEEYAPINPNNILDKVHCIILKGVIDTALGTMRIKLGEAKSHDKDLTRFYEDTLSAAPSGFHHSSRAHPARARGSYSSYRMVDANETVSALETIAEGTCMGHRRDAMQGIVHESPA